jgi:hypothetical protein
MTRSAPEAGARILAAVRAIEGYLKNEAGGSTRAASPHVLEPALVHVEGPST